jgi:hypothetical protein
MTALYFHCSDDEHVLMDRTGRAMNLSEAREHAERLVRTYVMTPSSEDWRNWILHVTDDLGTEIFELPFATIVGQLH